MFGTHHQLQRSRLFDDQLLSLFDSPRESIADILEAPQEQHTVRTLHDVRLLVNDA
jgi:hypothetical protein